MTKILYIGNKLSSKGNTVSTIDTLSKRLSSECFHVISVSKIKNKVFRLLDMVFALIRLRNRVDYVLIDTYSTQNFYFAYIISQLCRLFNLNYIPILHGGNLPNRLKHNPKLSGCIFKNSFINISPSKYLENKFKSFGYQNVRYLPNSIQLSNYKYNLKKIDKPKLLWVRSLAKIYNPKMAIEVLAELRQRGINAELCMVGPDKEGLIHDLKQFAEKNNVHVTFTGKLSKSEWIELSKNYNIFINTTNFDNMPVSIIEAMALGFPIVSTNVGGLPFLIEDNKDGILVKPNTSKQMAEKIVELSKNPELLKKLSEHARKKAEEFDWETIKQMWKELLI